MMMKLIGGSPNEVFTGSVLPIDQVITSIATKTKLLVIFHACFARTLAAIPVDVVQRQTAEAINESKATVTAKASSVDRVKGFACTRHINTNPLEEELLTVASSVGDTLTLLELVPQRTVVALSCVIIVPVTGNVNLLARVIGLVKPIPRLTAQVEAPLRAAPVYVDLVIGRAVLALAVFFVEHAVENPPQALIEIEDLDLVASVGVNNRRHFSSVGESHWVW